AIAEVFEECEAGRIFTRDLLQALVKRETEPWGEWWGKDVAQTMPGDTPRGPAVRLARLLRPLGGAPKTIRIREKREKGYERTDFEDAFDRYLASAPEESTAAPEEPGEPQTPSEVVTTGQPAPDVGLRAEEVVTLPPPVTTSNDAETVGGQGLSPCHDLHGRSAQQQVGV